MYDMKAQLLVGAAVLLGLGEVAMAVVSDVPGMAAAFAALFLLGAWLYRSGRRSAGAVLIAALALLEIVFLPAYDRKDTWDWVAQIGFGVVSAIALGAAIALITGARRTIRAST